MRDRLIGLLKGLALRERNVIGYHHRGRTPSCPSMGRLHPRFISQLSEVERAHIEHCTFCQLVRQQFEPRASEKAGDKEADQLRTMSVPRMGPQRAEVYEAPVHRSAKPKTIA